MRKVQHGLLQQRPGDAGPGPRVPHGVFSVLGVQPAPPARGRVLPAGRRAAVSGRPRPAGGARVRGEPAQPGARPQETAAHLRYFHGTNVIVVVDNEPQSVHVFPRTL